MKKLFITAALIMAFGLCCNAQEGKNNVTVTKQGKTYWKAIPVKPEELKG